MDLVEQYLRAVAALLPRSQREDIVAELRDIILSRIEAREAERGRTLTDDEIEAELRVIGHPIVVAQRYREEPQHLIGPALYPYWLFGVKAAIALELLVALIVFFIQIISGHDPAQALGHAISQGIVGAATLVGFATLAAWALERGKFKLNYLDQWRVRDLRVLEYATFDWRDLNERVRAAQAREQRASRDGERAAARGGRIHRRVERRLRRHAPVGEALAAVAWGTVFVLWWTGVLHFGFIGRVSDLRELGLDAGELGALNWSDVRDALFWPVLAYGLAIIAQGALVLAYPRAVRLRGLTDIAIGVGVLGFCVWAWTASPMAGSIAAESVSDFILRIKTAFQQSPPLALAPMLMMVVPFLAFGAVCRALRGLWLLVTPEPTLAMA